MNVIADTKDLSRATTDVNLKAVEFELALGAEDILANGFEACVEKAAQSAGFRPLFNLPVPPNDQLQRLAAVACMDESEPVFTFVALNNSGDQAIVQPDLSSLPHVEKFAEAFFGLMVN